ncbi:class-II fumarase/aspartase family protein [Streptomyces boncukensis]|uniref:Adenylosuccinate lyase family protein n=1 Tax=Streptomyces boncukensis TaxID=2711219 RepID=A0A6G4WY60_9ACTN|nr:adenylosuccinate lyase family protein [Streptomyces boncukensis]NGO70048.1 adenylosuccinate lyase family protein [Streptomyces boncukensis]
MSDAPSHAVDPGPPPPGTDSGLLAPVRAGTGPEALLSDEAWVAAMLEAEVALARAQAALGVIPARSADAVAKAARSARIDTAALARDSRGAANPVVELVPRLTAAVADTDPEAAVHVHLGSTSQDILDSAAMLLAARALAAVERDLARTSDALAALARDHRGTPMAARTLGQHAVPTTFGLKAAGWLSSVLDAAARVRDTARALPAQLGGAAGTLAAYEEYARAAAPREGQPPPGGPALAARFAQELGLADPPIPWHSLRMPLCDLGGTLNAVTGALGKFALDVQTLSRTEIGEVAEPAATGRGVSSAMPQKRNPVLATLIVSAARQVPAYTSVLAQSMLAEDERAPGAWHAEWQPLREALRLAGGAAHTAAELAGGLEVHPAALRRNLELTGGAVVAERLNAVLAPLLGKAGAKRLLADCARRAAAGQGSFGELLSRELPGTPADGLRAGELLDPEGYLGAADGLVDRVLARHAAEGRRRTEGGEPA